MLFMFSNNSQYSQTNNIQSNSQLTFTRDVLRIGTSKMHRKMKTRRWMRHEDSQTDLPLATVQNSSSTLATGDLTYRKLGHVNFRIFNHFDELRSIDGNWNSSIAMIELEKNRMGPNCKQTCLNLSSDLGWMQIRDSSFWPDRLIKSQSDGVVNTSTLLLTMRGS